MLDSIVSTKSFDKATGLWSRTGWRVRAAELIAGAPAHVVLVLVRLHRDDAETVVSAALTSMFGSVPPLRAGLRRLGGLVSSLQARLKRRRPLQGKTLEHAVGYYDSQCVALVAEVDLASAGRLVVRDVRARLKQAGVLCSIGSAVGAGVELPALLAEAEQDLQFEEITADLLAPDGG